MTSPSQDSPLPSSTDDRYLSMGSQGTAHPEGTISTNQFFLENMKLMRILGSILSNVYHSSEPGHRLTPYAIPGLVIRLSWILRLHWRILRVAYTQLSIGARRPM